MAEDDPQSYVSLNIKHIVEEELYKQYGRKVRKRILGDILGYATAISLYGLAWKLNEGPSMHSPGAIISSIIFLWIIIQYRGLFTISGIIAYIVEALHSEDVGRWIARLSFTTAGKMLFRDIKRTLMLITLMWPASVYSSIALYLVTTFATASAIDITLRGFRMYKGWYGNNPEEASEIISELRKDDKNDGSSGGGIHEIFADGVTASVRQEQWPAEQVPAKSS